MRNKNIASLIAAFVVSTILVGCAIDNKKEIAELESLAKNGNQEAQYKLGYVYDKGMGTQRALVKAFSWYLKAAEQGHPIAQNNVGSMYQFGEGVERNYEKSIYWYVKSAEQGYAEGIVNLGYMYDAGLGVKEDKSHAADLYQKGAEKGNAQGMLNLGLSYYRGEGVKKDILKAFMWLDLARFYTQWSSNKKMKWHIRGQLDNVKSTMSQEQISKGQSMSRKWHEEHKVEK